MPAGWIYITTNRPDGTLYVGVTNHLTRRIGKHQLGLGSAFTARHKLRRHKDMITATHREKRIKHWPGAWKVRLIVAGNPEWEDLSVGLM